MLVLGRHKHGSSAVPGMDEWLRISMPDGTSVHVGIAKVLSGRKATICISAPATVAIERVLVPVGVDPIHHPEAVTSQAIRRHASLGGEA